MTILFVITGMLLPQMIATQRNLGPAGHLTLLLFSICFVTAVLISATLGLLAQSNKDFETFELVFEINLMGYSMIGLTMLTPLYWVVESQSNIVDHRIDTTLALALALTVTASTAATLTATRFQLVESLSLGLVTVMFIRAIWLLFPRHNQT
ncbi:hypothetical protein [Sulfitobacter donghicola]|nr:hypothetical protein [Sulfitobacter donghicola]KIN66810.1 hypothetical protein Z948_514 [Sulfitobacter donghicola DSW-25 = KCTC 12864 = JCM 14565]